MEKHSSQRDQGMQDLNERRVLMVAKSRQEARVMGAEAMQTKYWQTGGVTSLWFDLTVSGAR